jgi:hypothetical protein
VQTFSDGLGKIKGEKLTPQEARGNMEVEYFVGATQHNAWPLQQ